MLYISKQDNMRIMNKDVIALKETEYIFSRGF